MKIELWNGVSFKLAEAKFFLEQMGKVLVPPQAAGPVWHPSMMGHVTARWQPDFYYYLDAFVEAARSVPDVIQTCFGWDRSTKAWISPSETEEINRRNNFQAEFTRLYSQFHRQLLSRVRIGTHHWLGIPSVQATGKVFAGQEYIGGPLDRIPDLAARQSLPGADPPLAVLASKPLPVEPSGEDFKILIPQDDGTTRYQPLFEECRAYV